MAEEVPLPPRVQVKSDEVHPRTRRWAVERGVEATPHAERLTFRHVSHVMKIK